ncbi:type II secretion system F family protein [Phycicoccus flavus]|uniref:type II secretion system F family protein n=1 Tax=Phycicoccus flavus TaxID=2502783 RepID=UPI000FEBA2A8|nr:type II secretion system F family protein [Phycicoccus flavus]NHA69460.1 type II secretion protein F [Phycicoccus flavus]
MIIAIVLGAMLASVLALVGAREFARAARERHVAITGAESGLGDDEPSTLEVFDGWFRRTRPGRWLVRELDVAGIDRRPSVVFFGGVLLGAAIAVALWTLLAPLLGVFGLVLGAVGVRLYLRRARERRREAFVGQLPELARVLANASYAGLSLPTAIAIAGDELAEPARTELSRVATRLRFGAPLTSALDDLRERVGSRETSVLISTLVVASRSGGSLVTALRDIAETLDQRKETRREVRTVLAQPVVTSYFVIVLGVVMLLMLNLMQPGTVDKMTRQPLGQGALAVAFAIFGGGFYAIRRITRMDI